MSALVLLPKKLSKLDERDLWPVADDVLMHKCFIADWFCLAVQQHGSCHHLEALGCQC